MTPPSPRPRPRQDGFTLVEMLVVIVIIGILVALLIPALAGAVRSARNAQASAEINNLAAALAQFKNQYGDYPPSRILLSESGEYPTNSGTPLSEVPKTSWVGGVGPNFAVTSDITLGQLAQRSLQHLQKFFPKAQLRQNTTWGHYWPDFNGNGRLDPGYIYLEGHECLVFFLGGMPQPNGSNRAFQIGDGMIGFGKDPRFPFKRFPTVTDEQNRDEPIIAANITTNRTQPMYEFQANRLVDEDGDGIPGYVDNFHNTQDLRFYAYFSSYGNNNYDHNDVNLPLSGGFDEPLDPVAPAPNPYFSRVGQFINPNSFQIISPGADGIYGFGGQYDATSTGDRLPGNGREPERDNVTNFSGGAMD